MCGISGFYNPHADFPAREDYFRHILQTQLSLFSKRGPDASGIFLSNRCGLAHTKLSGIDTETDSQPISQTIHNYEYAIIHDSDIYNVPELKKDLSHGELLPAFLKYGPDFIKRIDGAFAVAVYDGRHQTLHLFRDSFGIKPLFYTILDGTLIFSSEIKGILAFPGVDTKLDTNGINEILGLGPARTPGNGVLQNIKEVLPGQYISYHRFGIYPVTYWRLESRPHTDNYPDTLEKTRFLISNAITKQMVSDVPVCTFLSGGVDSSVVSAVCAKELEKQNQQLTTFSFDFTENDRYFQSNSFQPTQDRPFVDRMVSYLDSEHHYLECDNTTQAALLYESVDAHDLPCMADIDSSLLYFCSLVGKTHKVVLTGECADEVFGGYPWFHREEFLQSTSFPWTPSLEPRKALLKDEILAALNMDEYVQAAYNSSVCQINLLPEESPAEAARRRIAYLNLRWFMQTLLNRMDRTGMRSGLTARVPFADRALVEYIFNVPWEMKAKDGLVKNLLRQSSVGIVPDEILFRRKSPYPKTYHPLYEKMLTDRLNEILNEQSSPLLALVDTDKVGHFLANPKDYGTPWYGQLMAGPQMIAYLLQINYWLEKYKIEICV